MGTRYPNPGEREYVGTIVKYSFLPDTLPFCTSACSHCYIRSSDALRDRVKKSEEQVLSEITCLIKDGYRVIPLTTELLLMKNWKEILRTVGEKKVYTNGKLIAEDPKFIEDMMREGIEEVHLTGNVPKYNDRLNLVKIETIDRALKMIIDAGIKPVMTLLITSDNCEHLESMLEYPISNGVMDLNFIRVIGNEDYVMSRKQTLRFFHDFKRAKRKHRNMKMNLDSSFGYMHESRKRSTFFCGAGVDKIDIGYDDYLYPCSLLQYKEYRIGIFRNGKIILEREIPQHSLDKNDCLAYQLMKMKRCK